MALHGQTIPLQMVLLAILFMQLLLIKRVINGLGPGEGSFKI